MSQRVSGYIRRDLEHYPTPNWVLHALAEHLKLAGQRVWEPACGTGEMCAALLEAGVLSVVATDIKDRGYHGIHAVADFLKSEPPSRAAWNGIVTNPPFGKQGRLAEAFIERGLQLLAEHGGFMALLLPVDFDSGKTRRRFFRDCPMFAGQVVLTKRIKWFDEPVPCKKCGGTGAIGEFKCKPCKGTGEVSPGPSQNHCWMIWEASALNVVTPPFKFYAPSDEVVADVESEEAAAELEAA